MTSKIRRTTSSKTRVSPEISEELRMLNALSLRRPGSEKAETPRSA